MYVINLIFEQIEKRCHSVSIKNIFAPYFGGSWSFVFSCISWDRKTRRWHVHSETRVFYGQTRGQSDRPWRPGGEAQQADHQSDLASFTGDKRIWPKPGARGGGFGTSLARLSGQIPMWFYINFVFNEVLPSSKMWFIDLSINLNIEIEINIWRVT